MLNQYEGMAKCFQTKLQRISLVNSKVKDLQQLHYKDQTYSKTI